MTLAKRLQKLEASVVVERQEKRQAQPADERRRERDALELLTRVRARLRREAGRAFVVAESEIPLLSDQRLLEVNDLFDGPDFTVFVETLRDAPRDCSGLTDTAGESQPSDTTATPTSCVPRPAA